MPKPSNPISRALTFAKARPGLVLAAAVLFVSVLMLNPLREFPLDDDWAYSLAVEHLLEDGRLRIPDFATPNLVAHTLWGALFAKVFFLNYASLRASTLVLALVCLGGLYFLLRRVSVDDREAGSGALLLAANPIFLLLSLSYMTDVPYLAWTLMALVCFVRADKKGDGWLLAAAAFSTAAYLVRQIGILLPIGMILQLALCRKLNLRKTALIGLIPGLSAAGHMTWFLYFHGPTWAYQAYLIGATGGHLSNLGGLAGSAAYRCLVAAMLTGLFLFPLSAALAAAPGGFKRLQNLWALGSFSALLTANLFLGGMPFSPDTSGVMNRYGLGTISLPAAEAKAAGLFGMPLFWSFLTVLAAASLVYLAALLKERWSKLPPGARLLPLPGVLPFAATLFGAYFFDRYLLPLLPLAFALAFAASKDLPRRNPLFFGAAALMWLVSMAGTLDYLNWNAAKWEAGEKAVRAGTPPHLVYNGRDWAGTLYFERSIAELKKRKPLDKIERGEWMLRSGFEATTSFSPEPPDGRFERAGSTSYWSPLKPGRAQVYLYKTKRKS